MLPIVTDRVAWPICLLVCRSVTVVSPAKTTQPIEMLFGLRTQVGPRNHVGLLDVVHIVPYEGAIFRGKDIPEHVRRYSATSFAKMAEPIEMPFGLWTRVGPRKHVLWVRTGATW